MKNISAAILLILVGALWLAAPVLASDISAYAEYVKPSVVTVRANNSLGTGFFVNPQGYVLTNAHVIDNSDKLVIRLVGGDEVRAKLVAEDDQRDLAILKVKDRANFPSVIFGTFAVKNGQEVFTIGSPMGMEFTVSKGIVSNAVRKVEDNKYIQTDIAINAGNSGGPLITDKGYVVGVISSKLQQSEGIGFAVPAKEILEFFAEQGIPVAMVSIGDEATKGTLKPGTTVQPKKAQKTESTFDYAYWLYGAGGLLILLALIMGFFFVRKRKRRGAQNPNVVLGSSQNVGLSREEKLDDIDIELK